MKTKPNLGGLRDQLASQLAAMGATPPPARPPVVEKAVVPDKSTAAKPSDTPREPEAPPAPATPESPPASRAEVSEKPSAVPTRDSKNDGGQGSAAALPAGLQVAREAMASPKPAARKAIPKAAPPPPPPVTSVEVNARLFQEDLEQLSIIQERMKRQTGRISIGMAAAIRVAIRAFDSEKSPEAIMVEVNSQDGRGRWSR